MSDLFKDLPDLSVITARAGEKTYLGAFYLDQNGIKMASYESSGFEISINFFEMSDHDLSVSYSLKDIGNEVKSATGEIYNFVFQISLKEMNKQLGEDPDGLFMDVEVTEMY